MKQKLLDMIAELEKEIIIFDNKNRKKFEKTLIAEGWDVIVFVPSKEEDTDRITCGNALLAIQ